MDTKWMVGMLMVIIMGHTENSMTVKHCSKNTPEVELVGRPS